MKNVKMRVIKRVVLELVIPESEAGLADEGEINELVEDMNGDDMAAAVEHGVNRRGIGSNAQVWCVRDSNP